MRPDIVILGAGPAGLGAASQLARRNLGRVTVLEQNRWVGGNAASFEIAGIPVDYGSHRLHPASDTEILQDIRSMLGDDLLDRPRHGRIYLQQKWIHFPLKPQDLLLHTTPGFALNAAADMAIRVFRKSQSDAENESFASELEASLGKTVYRNFYSPYAMKIWGVPAEQLSAIQARKRVSANSPLKMARKLLGAVPGFKKPGSGRFFYPRQGFGQISKAYEQLSRENGAEIILGARVQRIQGPEQSQFKVEYSVDGETQSIRADYVWSTIPINVLSRLMDPGPPEGILQAAGQIDYRSIILVYLVLGQAQFTEFDAHYFPGEDIPITRLSEPKNYSARQDPADHTVLCAELPCSPGDSYWEMSDEQLGNLVIESLSRVKLPVQAPLIQVLTRRLRHAYPIYLSGYENHLRNLDEWLGQIDHLLTFGRQGLFAHDNTHHALYMAYRAVDCLDQAGRFDQSCWQEARRVFESHVVED